LLNWQILRSYFDCDISKNRIKATDSVPAVIPGGLTKVLQPLDISVNKCFKAELRRIWEWMTSGEKSFTKTGRMRRASYETVCGWVKAAWACVPDTTIISGFVKAGIVDVPLPEDNHEVPLAESTDELPLAVAAIFHSDTEESDFDGFEEGDSRPC
jgi:hypothetical protein